MAITMEQRAKLAAQAMSLNVTRMRKKTTKTAVPSRSFCLYAAGNSKEACGEEPTKLLREIGDLIAELYPECDKAVFTIYKRCGDYIRDNI